MNVNEAIAVVAAMAATDPNATGTPDGSTPAPEAPPTPDPAPEQVTPSVSPDGQSPEDRIAELSQRIETLERALANLMESDVADVPIEPSDTGDSEDTSSDPTMNEPDEKK